MFEQIDASYRGLSTIDAQQQLLLYGYNEIVEKSTHPLLKFLRYFWGPISWMIEIAALLSIVVRDWIGFNLILSLLLINSLIRFFEEHKASNAMAALKMQLAIKARVFRDHHWKTIPARELVPGDRVTIHLGDIVPADIRMLRGKNVEVDQAVLTGESLPVEKEEGGSLYSGSVLTRGECHGIVVSTGEQTYFGKTVQLVRTAKPVDHFQQAVMRIGRFLIASTLVLIVCMLIAALIRHTLFIDAIQFLLILTVAAIPVALPAVLSVTMAVGATQLSKLKSIVSHLESIGELAGMDVLCADKTGTLTKNCLQLGEPILLSSLTKQELLMNAALSCDLASPEAIDRLIMSCVHDQTALHHRNVTTYLPFDPVSKRSEVTLDDGEGLHKISKGAAQVIIQLCHLEAAQQEKTQKLIDDFAQQGYRVMGVAGQFLAQPWELLGLLPIFDPVRADAAETIARAKALHVNVKMITGDNLAIAKEVGEQVGLGRQILDANQLYSQNDVDTIRLIENSDGFAEVFPEHKFHIVKLLQQNNHIVGMTGDGVNDAPALKQADVGIAVSGATDAPRSAADLVLTAPGLSVIIDAIHKSRQIFHRMNSYAIYRIAETIRVLFFLALSILIFNIYPLTTVMILILALLNDLPIMTIAYDQARINQQPVRWRMSKTLIISLSLGVFGVLSSFLLLWLTKSIWSLDMAMIKTMMFLKMTASGHMTIYLARTGEKPFYVKPWPSPLLFFTIESTQIIGTLFAVYGLLMPAIGWKWALLIWGYSLIEFIINDYVKITGYKLSRLLKII